MKTSRTGILRALTLALLLAALLVIGTASAVAEQGIGTFAELEKAMKTGGEYYLTDNIKMESLVFIGGENDPIKTTLDTAGFNITSDEEWVFVVDEGGTLTIKNTKSTGTVEALKAWSMFYVYEGGMLSVESGNYHASHFAVNDGGTMYIKGGRIEGIGTIQDADADTLSDSYGPYVFTLQNGSKTYMTGGTITCPAGGISMRTIWPATVEVTSRLSQGTNYVNKKYMLTEDQYNNPVKLVYGNADGTGPSLRVDDGTIVSNVYLSPTDITINGGELIATGENKTAIYHPQQGTFTMNGGLIQGASGIEAKMGHFTFNGGYVVATGNVEGAPDYAGTTGQTTPNSSALKLELGYYGARDEDGLKGARGMMTWHALEGTVWHLPRDNDFSLKITDGVFISQGKIPPITATNWNMCAENVSYEITGGRFSYFPKTYYMTHDENDGVTQDAKEPINATVKSALYYLQDGQCSMSGYKEGSYKFAPAAYYDAIDLLYGFKGKDAAYYAGMADAIADRPNDPDARAYIYYLLDNGLPQTGRTDRQLQIFYNLKDEFCGRWIPEGLDVGTEKAVFGYRFEPKNVTFNPAQYVLTDTPNSVALWSPAVTYDTNGGQFADGSKLTTVLATTASGLFDGKGYGYVVDAINGRSYETLDEGGSAIAPPAATVLINPDEPTRAEYIFKGWFEAPSGGIEFDKSQQILANKTVYARWEPIGGTSTETPTETPIATPTETPNKPVPKTGDSSRPFLWAGLLLVSAAAAAVFLLRGRRHQ